MEPCNCGRSDTFTDANGQSVTSATSDASRRRFLKTLAAAGMGAILPATGLIAQITGPAATAKRRRIDVHHHMVPPEAVKRRSGLWRSWNWTPDISLAQMEKYDIASAILSITTPGIWFGDIQETRTLARICHDYGAQVVRDHPSRFGLFAALPLPDADASLREVEYVYDTLKADGISLLSSYGDKYPGDPAFTPVFEELNRRKAVIFLHVTVPPCCGNLVPGGSSSMAEGDFDMTRAIQSFLLNGTFTRFPEIRFIVNHSGGTLPVLSGRINDRFPKDRRDRVPDGVLPELKKLYYEVAHATYPAPLGALTKFVGTPQMLFGTDYPAEAIETTVKPLAEWGFSPQDLQAIDRGNAERLLPRFKA